MQVPPAAPLDAPGEAPPVVGEFDNTDKMLRFASPARMRRRRTLENIHGPFTDLQSAQYYKAHFEQERLYRVLGVPLWRRKVQLFPGLLEQIEALRTASPTQNDFINQTTRRSLVLRDKIARFRAPLNQDSDAAHELWKLDRILASQVWPRPLGSQVLDYEDNDHVPLSVHISRVDDKRTPSAATPLQVELSDDFRDILRIPLPQALAEQASRIPLVEWCAWGREFGFTAVRYDAGTRTLSLCNLVEVVDGWGKQRWLPGRIVSLPAKPPRGQDVKHSSPARHPVGRPDGVAVLDTQTLAAFLARPRGPASG